MPKATHVSPGGVKLLQEPQLAHFVTLMSDGSPQVSPVWVDVDADGTHVMINTAANRVKTRNTNNDNRVAVSVVDARNPARYVLVRGTVVEHRTEGARAHINALSKKYTGADTYTFGPPDEERLIIVIEPHFVTEQGV